MPTPTLPPFDAADVLARKRAVSKPFRLCMDPDLAMRVRELEAQRNDVDRALDRAVHLDFGPDHIDGLRSKLDQLDQQLDEARKAADAETVEFVFRAIGRKALAALVRKHPPSAEEREKARTEHKEAGHPMSKFVPPQWDDETFPPELIAHASVSPKFTVEQARELWNSPEWSHAELSAIFQAAWNVNQALTSTL